jgi:hypothetical protein
LAGAALCLLLIVKSGNRYCQRLSQLRAIGPFETNRPES